MTPVIEPDEELLRRMQGGDEEAFIQLYRRRQGAIYRFAYHMTGSAATAEDVAQDVFLALIKTGGGFDPARGTLPAYLFGIARKMVLRHLDRSRALIALDSDGQEGSMAGLALSTDPMVDLMHREGLEQLRQAVLSLPKRYREVVALCDLQEMDYVAAAAALDCPVGTVRSRLHRARGLLLEKLQKREPRPVRALNPARSLI